MIINFRMKLQMYLFFQSETFITHQYKAILYAMYFYDVLYMYTLHCEGLSTAGMHGTPNSSTG